MHAHQRLYDQRIEQDGAELDRRLRAAGASPDQVHAIVESITTRARSTEGLVVGVASAAIGATMFTGVTLASLLLAGRRREGEPVP